MTRQYHLASMLAGFHPQALATTISSLTSPGSISPQSTAALSLGLLHTPQSPAPSLCAFQGTLFPVWSMCGCGKDCLILLPFRLPPIGCFTPSLKCFSSGSDNCPNVGIRSLLQFPHLLRARPVLLTLLFFPLVSCTWFYIFSSAGQVLLSTLSCCSACTSVSEGVFLMYPRREMHSTSTYSSAILFASPN